MFRILFITAIVANLYVFWHLWAMVPAGSFVRPLLIALGVVAVVTMSAAFMGRDKLPQSVIGIVYGAGTAWLFTMLYFVLVFLVLDLLRLTHLVPLKQWMFGSWPGFWAVTGAVLLLMVAGYVRYRNKARVELSIVTDRWEAGVEPLKIVALSDLHLGYTIGRREFEGWVERINAERPDVVLLVGDVIDSDLRPLIESDLASSFRKIESRYGVFAAPGNHEYIAGIDGSLAFLRDAGATVLRDSTALVGGRVWVVGRDDRSNRHRQPLDELIGPLNRSKPVIVLDHQPHRLEQAERAGATLQLSGHTHRGQVWPASLLVDRMYEKAYGSLKKGDTNYYISSGMGLWGGKFRIGTRSEYVVITLTGE